MGKIEKLLMVKLAQKAKKAKLAEGLECPQEAALANYILGRLSQQEKENIETHIAECFLCLDKIVSAYDGEKLLRKRKVKEPPKKVTWKAKNIDRISEELIKNRIDFALNKKDLLPKTKKLLSTEKTVIKWLPKNLKKNRWLIASITAFVLSFAFPPLFLQFLLAAGILGGKWIFDSENAKTLIMIYNAWKKGGEKEAGEMLKVLKDRIPNKR